MNVELGRMRMEAVVVYLMHYRDIHIGMLGNTSDKLKKDRRRLGQDLNLGTPEYKTGVGLLLTRYAQQKFHLVMLHNPAEETFVSQEECLTLRRLMSYIYIYGAPILDVSRSHTTTHHSR